MAQPLDRILYEAEYRRLLHGALAVTGQLVRHTRGPLRNRWLKHERQLDEALRALEAKLEQ